MEEPRNLNVSRRGFLAGSAIAAGALMLSGCSPKAQEEVVVESNAVEVDENAERVDCDVVVVGAGTSGSCAGLAAALAGARTIVVEKTNTLGGLSNYSTFILGTDTDLQKEAGYSVPTDDIYQFICTYYASTCNLPLVRNVLNSSSETIDWLQENGLALAAMPEGLDVQTSRSGMPTYTGHMMLGPNNLDSAKGNEGIFGGLHKRFQEAGGEFLMNTEVIKLLSDESDSVSGIVCRKEDGSQLVIDAKAVIVSAGGYSGDCDYFKSSISHTDWPNMVGEAANDGTGVRVIEEAGGQPWYNGPHMHQCYFSDPDSSERPDMRFTEFTLLSRMPVFMWVGSDGDRFTDESVAGDFAWWSNAALSQGGSYWLVLDQPTLDDLEKNGTPVEVVSSQGVEEFRSGDENIMNNVGMKSGPITSLQSIVDEYVEDGAVLRADSIEALAEAMGADPGILTASVSEYNAAVDEKHDALFLKDPKYLVYKNETGPFYAFRVTANVEGGALGGVRVNKNLQCYVKETGLPFKNLFATGLNASGFFGYGVYSNVIGSTMGFAANSGRLAGEAAAERALKA